MTFDDLDVGKCPYCGGDLIKEEDGDTYCEDCDTYFSDLEWEICEQK